MKYLPLLFSIIYFTSCSNLNENKSKLYNLSSAKDAYDYPNLANKSDTDIYIYQLKDTLNTEDSFLYVNYGTYYLKQFNEQNLSLRPLTLETFRFSYTGVCPINITFDKNEIVVKLWTSGSLDPIYNEDKLNVSEIGKFRFLEHYFFRSKESFSQSRLNYYDSMVVKYPELTSIKYYKELISKCTDYDSLKFEYTTKRIPLTNEQYTLLIDSLEKSGFANLSWKVDYPETVMDGGGYTFEANTKTKFKYFVCYGLPIDSLPMTRFCRYLLQVAKVDKEINL